MNRLSDFARIPLLTAIAIVSLAGSQASAAGRDGRDYVIDSQRGAPRTGLLRQCIRTGLPEAGTSVDECSGTAPVAAPLAAGDDGVRSYAEERVAPADDGIVVTRVNADFEAEQAAALAEAKRAEAERAAAERAAAEQAEAERVAAEKAALERAEAQRAAAERAEAERAAAERAEAERAAAERAEAERAAAERARAERAAAERAEAERAAAEAAAAPSVARMTLTADADFDFGKSTLRPAGRKKLDEFADALKTTEYSTIHVVGHTDRIGSRQANEKLSLRRAQAVKDHLVSHGILSDRIEAKGVGFDQPLTKPDDCQGLGREALIACLQPDRRVEVDAQAVKVVKQ